MSLDSNDSENLERIANAVERIANTLIGKKVFANGQITEILDMIAMNTDDKPRK